MQQNNPKQRKKPTRREKVVGGGQVLQREHNKLWSEQYGMTKIQLTDKQKVLRNKILENDLTFVVGSSGSGKTLAVLYTYVQEYLRDPSKQILVVRTPVEAGLDKIGALPNSLQEKVEPHFNSTKILLCDLLSKGKVETDLDHRIHFKIPNYMLGSTFDNCLILIDECFTEEHSFLTKNGWKPVKEVSIEDEVLQYNEDGTCDFVKPLRKIQKNYKGQIVQYNTGNSSYSVTPNHRNVYLNSSKELSIKLAKDSSGTNWYFVNSSKGNNNSEYNITDQDIRLAVAVQADGSLQRTKETGESNCQISFKKERKIDRFMALNEELGGMFNEIKCKLNSRRWYCGSFYSELLSGGSGKDFNFEVLSKFSTRQMRLFISELAHWDGSFYKNSESTVGDFVYCTTNKHNVDTVQAISAMCGYTTTVCKSTDNRKESYKDYYRVSIRDTDCVSTTQKADKNKTFTDFDGEVYCVTVPSGMLFTKKDDKVMVSGNCQQLSPLILKLVLERTGVNSKVCVLGDNSQLYVDAKGRNALRDAIPRFFKNDGTPKFNSVTYHEFDVEDVVRSELTKTIIKAYS